MYNHNDNVDVNEQYKTTDIGSAVALVSLGYSLVSLDKSNPHLQQKEYCIASFFHL